MRICSIVSARPNFVKLAGVVHAFGCHAEESAEADVSKHEHFIIHTGQHSDPLFSDIFFKELDIPDPDYNLGVKSAGNNEETIKATSEACIDAIKDANPDVVLVYGDVSGALGGALAAKEVGIPVVHIEAGLRSGDMDMPEERNRIEIDKLSKYLFVTEKSGLENLEKEGIEGEAHFVGNTMIDTLIRMLPAIEKQNLPLGIPEKFGVVTMHRPSNVDQKSDLERNLQFLNDVSERCLLVFPMHIRTRNSIEKYGLQDMLSDKVKVIDPLGYLAFLKLASESEFILTDSGGIQEEAVLLKKRCFTMRRNTERPVTKQVRSNMLVYVDDDGDREQVFTYADNPDSPNIAIPEKWDGKAGERIIKILQTST
jgi:UDP-N-acetylglucosamine 2-epimerase (non-hydrolysing)